MAPVDVAHPFVQVALDLLQLVIDVADLTLDALQDEHDEESDHRQHDADEEEGVVLGHGGPLDRDLSYAHTDSANTTVYAA